MPVTFNPFISKSGFKSGDFEVDSLGDLTAKDIVANTILATSIDAASITINGVPVIGNNDSTINTFQIETDFIVSEGSTPYLSIINGQVTITNRSDSVGKIDNIDIGTNTPGIGNFTSISTGVLGIPSIASSTNLNLAANNAIVFQINGTNRGRINEDGLDIPVVNTTINNTVIGNTTPTTGSFTSVTLSNAPSLPSSATRKDYVDNQISAFAIAFGI